MDVPTCYPRLKKVLISKITLILNGKHTFVYGDQIYRKNIKIYFYQGNLLKFMGNQKKKTC